MTKRNLDDILKLPVKKSLFHRLPWLVLGLFGGLVTAGIVNGFEAILEKNLILAAYIPLLVYMSDAVGTQMEAFMIRDLALNEKLDFVKYFFRQMLIVSLIGLLTSGLLFVFALTVYGKLMIALVLSLSLFVGICSSVLTGLIVPYFLGRFKFDPANASGPIATIIQDTLMVLIYFSIASWLL